MTSEMDPEGMLRMAESFAAAENYGGAMNLYRQAAIKLPDDLRPLVGMAGIYWQSGGLEEAARLYRQVLAIDPLNSEAAGNVAQEILYLGDAAEAIGFINDFLVKGQGSSTLFNALGVAYDLIGNRDGAQLAYAEGLDFTPGDPAILNNLALSFAVHGDYQTAVGLIQQSLDSPESQRQGRQNLALIYALSGQVDVAIEIAATVLSDEEVAINRVFYSRLAPLSRADKAVAVFLGQLPGRSPDKTLDISTNAEERPAVTMPGQPEDLPILPDAIIEGEGGEPEATETVQVSTPDTLPEKSTTDLATPAAEASIAQSEVDDILGAQPQALDQLEADFPPYWIQLGSYRSVARVEQGWHTLTEAHNDLLAAYDPFIQNYESADQGKYERLLLAGFETRSAANLLCGELQISGVDCLVLQTSGNIRSLSEVDAEGADPVTP